MANTKKENEVISSKTRSTRKTKENTEVKPKKRSNAKTSGAKKTVKSSKAKTNNSKQQKTTKRLIEKKNKNNKGLVKMYKKITKTIKENKFISIAILTAVVVSLSLLFVIMPIVSKNKVVITIDGSDYTSSDFMIYLYSVKYNHFGEDNTDLPEATLNTQVDSTSDMTIREYLKEKTVEEIKIAASVNRIAKENNITLTDEALKELEEEKEEYINNLGGESAFKKFLKKNNTTEESYDKMAKTDKLYKLIYDALYSEGKVNDLTDEEKEEARSEYYANYKKIKQIVLATVDSTTKESLSETTINQKEALAKAILEEAQSGVNFDDLIKKYSEDAVAKEPPYDMYYQNGDLLEEIEGMVNNLNTGDIGEVKTKYAIHIIQRQELDDAKLSVVYEKKREEKLLKNVSESLEKISIIYQNAFEKLEIK